MASDRAVELGFLEKAADPSQLTSPFFPSKAGGKPAWLRPRDLPAPERLACGVCGKPCVFLLQVYAPLSTTPHAFHRTIFLFMCSDSSCHERGGSGAFKVFRSQLPKANDFYDDMDNSSSESESDCGGDESGAQELRLPPKASAVHSGLLVDGGIDSQCVEELSEVESPEEPVRCEDNELAVREKERSTGNHKAGEPSDQDGRDTLALCVVCGCLAPKKCGRCKQVSYCSREHQVHDWRKGHRQVCSQAASGGASGDSDQPRGLGYSSSDGVLLEEFEIVTEQEPQAPVKKAERSEEERMKDYYKFIRSNQYSDIGEKQKKCKSAESGVVDSLEKAAMSMIQSDKEFNAFKKRVALDPEQVIRYHRGRQPLWLSSDGVPKSSDILNCSCGAKRTFEFQVMPQLLYFLKLDNIDWGTLLIYTCQLSCCHGNPYRDEFLWRQDPSSNLQ